MKPVKHHWGAATVWQGDVAACLREMPADSVHCVVTSPPYFNQRVYLPKDSPLKSLELGREKTPDEYVANMVRVFAEVRRVLRPDGVLWLNLGDSYAGGGRGGNPEDSPHQKRATNTGSLVERSEIPAGLKPLDTVNIPHRVAMALQADGWYWRDTIHWIKKSPMPASLSGWRWERCRVKASPMDRASNNGRKGDLKPQGAAVGLRSQRDDYNANKDKLWAACPGCAKCEPNEGWVLRKGAWRHTSAVEYIFMLTKSDTYFCDADAVKQPAAESTVGRDKYSRVIDDPDEQYAVAHDHETDSGGGVNPRNYFLIGPDAYKGPHYATFPREIPRRAIEASTSMMGCCGECGAPVARKVEVRKTTARQAEGYTRLSGRKDSNGAGNYTGGESRTVGWLPSCRCGSDARVPATVLDIFGGSGTTAQVAISMGRQAVMIDLDPRCIEQMRTRLDKSAALWTQAEIVA